MSLKDGYKKCDMERTGALVDCRTVVPDVPGLNLSTSAGWSFVVAFSKSYFHIF